jgi:multidrug efflux system membrane fusion protein
MTLNPQIRNIFAQIKTRWFRLWNHPRWRKVIIGLGIVLAFLIFYPHKHEKKAKMPMGVPVAVASCRRSDMPIYLDGLGSVTAFYTATVRSRVDGQLMSVNFNEGQYVQEGEELALIDPRPFQAQLDQAEGQLKRDQATLSNARLDLQRYQELIKQSAIPKQQLDTQAATVQQLEGVVKTDEAAVESARLQLVYAHITAPISGRIGLRLVDPGNIVHATDTTGLLVITQMQPIAVIFTLPEDSLPPVLAKIHAGQILAAEAYNRDKSQKLASGRLLSPDNLIDPNTGTLRLKAIFKNDEGTLFPNQFVNVRLLLETRHNQVLIPPVAIQRGSQGTFAYVVKPDNTAEMRLIKIGVIEGNDASVDSGLQAGEVVVIDGADKLQPGSPVSVQQNNVH